MTETSAIFGPAGQDIPRVGERLRSLSVGHHPLLGETLAYVFDTSGKRMRPALVLLSGMLGRYDVDRLITLAAALEVVHTATLVHDDTIDEALSRRGLATINAIWDRTVAILLGDFLFAQSAHLAAQLDSVAVMRLLSETVMEMSSGELRQYSATQTRTIDENDYFLRIAGKTASLFSMCCEGAAVVTGQNAEQAAALRAYGTNLGIAFQIADDVLDFVGDEHVLGKPAGSDLRQGTITLPAIIMAQHLDDDDPVRVSLLNGTDVDDVIAAVRDSGAIRAATNRAREYADTARRALDIFPPSAAKDTLSDLVDYVLERNH